MKAVKVGDIGTEHDGFHPTKVTAGSPDVFIDGKQAARVGDPLEPHDKPNHPKHDRAIASGSSTVFINGKPAALTGGSISCGGVTIGSGTVNIGDEAPSTGKKGAASEKNIAKPTESTSVLQELPVENMVAMNGSASTLAMLKSWGDLIMRINQEKLQCFVEPDVALRKVEKVIATALDNKEYRTYPISEVRVNNTLHTFEVYGNGELQVTYPVSSGRKGITDFMLKNEGPTPPGVYTVSPSEISEVHLLHYLVRHFRGDWGNARAPLHPADETVLYGRDSFFIHGGEFPGSAGCLDLGEKDLEFFKNLKNCTTSIKVIITQ